MERKAKANGKGRDKVHRIGQNASPTGGGQYLVVPRADR